MDIGDAEQGKAMHIGTERTCDTERPLASAIAEERRKKAESERYWGEVCASWNEFHATPGGIADEFNGGFLPDDDARSE